MSGLLALIGLALGPISSSAQEVEKDTSLVGDDSGEMLLMSGSYLGLPMVGAQSPTAASLGKFGDIPVRLYNGLPDISIPVHVASGRTHELPITLQYHASGIKVEEIPGWVGQNWALSAGGTVTRTMRGLPDESGPGYLGKRAQINTFLQETWMGIPTPMSTSHWDQLRDSEANFSDTQPDLFFFNVGGLSGKFYFHQDPGAGEQIVMIPHQPLKIKHQVSGGHITSWTIWGPDGTRYVFGRTEESKETRDQITLTYNSSWYVTEIYPAGEKDKITLSYEPGSFASHKPLPLEVHRVRINGQSSIFGCPENDAVSSLPNSGYTPQYLKYIDTGSERIEFVRASRLDVGSEARLDKILVRNRDATAVLKEIRFTYGYYNSASPTAKRLRLDQVREYNGSGAATNPGYTFTYLTTYSPPAFDSHSVDHWGFANGNGGSTGTLIPGLTYNGVHYPGAGREANQYSTAGVLKKIVYPTGGYTEFDFELNQYSYVRSTSVTTTSKPAGGVRIKEIRNYSAAGATPEIKRFEYSFSSGRSSGVLVTEPVYYNVRSQHDICTGSIPGQLTRCGAYLVRKSQSFIALGSTSGGHVGYAEVSVHTEGTASANREVHRFTTPSGPSGQLVWPQLPPPDESWAHGQEREVVVYSASGERVHRTEYQYASTNVSTAKTQGYIVSQEGQTNTQTTYCATNYVMTPFFRHHVAWKRMTSERNVFYDEATGDSMVVLKTYTHDSINQQPNGIVETDADGKQRTTEVMHAFRQYPGMEALNMLIQPYRRTVREGGASGTVQSRTWTLWANSWSSVRALNTSGTMVNTWMPHEDWTWLGSGSVPTTPGTANSIRSVTRNTYDGYGRVTKQTDARGAATEFFFGTNAAKFSNAEATSGFRNAFLTGVRTTAGSKTLQAEIARFSTGVKWGLVSQVKDHGGTVRNFNYDSHRRLNQVTNGGSQTLWQYDYAFTNGDPIASPNYVRSTQWLDGTGKVISTEYVDGLGRPRISETQDDARYVVSLTEYDARGRPAKSWLPYVSTVQAAYSTSDAVSYYDGSTSTDAKNFDRCGGAGSTPYLETTYRSDPLNRVASMEAPYCGSVTAATLRSYGVESNAMVELSTDEEGHETKVETDGWGRRIRSTGGFGTAVAATTTFTYDVSDRLTQVADPRNLLTMYAYDGLGRLTSRTNADAGLQKFKYNDAGDVRYRQDARQSGLDRVSFLRYDGFGRVTRIGEAPLGAVTWAALDGNTTQSFENSASNWLTVHHYDGKPPTGSFPWNISAFAAAITSATMSNLNGRLTATAHKSGGVWQLTLYSYFSDGTVQKKYIVTNGASSLTVTHTYVRNRQGEATRVHTAVGGQSWYQWYDYDARGLLWRVYSSTAATKPGSPDVTYSYTASGQVREEAFLGGSTIPRTYTIRDWLASIDDVSSPSRSFAAKYTYRKDGNLSIAEYNQTSSPASYKRYRHMVSNDALHRMTGAYLRVWTGNGYFFVSDHREGNIHYDASGNITALKRWGEGTLMDDLTFSYTSGTNRLFTLSDAAGAQASWDASTTYYAHDPSGNLTYREDFGRSYIDYLTYDERNQLIEFERIGSGGFTTRYRYSADGQRYWKKVGTSAADYYVLDGPLTVGVMTESGAVVH